MSSLSSSQEDIVLYLNAACTFLSISGEGYIFYHYFKFPEFRTFLERLVISLVCSELFYSIINIGLYFEQYQIVCVADAYLRAASMLSYVIWMTLIIWTIYKQFTVFDRNLKKKYPLYLFINILGSIATPTYALINYLTGGSIKFEA